MSRYAAYACPSAHKTATNVIVALIEGDDPLVSFNLSQPASPSGAEPATHWWGGRPVSEAWLTIYGDLAAHVPTPPGGWPLTQGQDTICTAEQALEAAAALHVAPAVGDQMDALPAAAWAALTADLGIVKITRGD